MLDRTTGQFISGQPFTQITWAKGLNEATGRPIVNPEAYYDNDPIGVEIYPTGGGAHNWSPMSYSPLTGLVYIPSSFSPFPYKATDELRPGSTGYVRPSGELRKYAVGPEVQRFDNIQVGDTVVLRYTEALGFKMITDK